MRLRNSIDAGLTLHREPSDTTSVWVISWTDCRGGARMQFYRVNGGVHRLPTRAPSNEKDAKKLVGRNRDIETADEMWSFFKDYSR